MVEVINSAIDSGDLDGHLAALVLHTRYRSLLEDNEMSLWVQAVEQLLCRHSVSSKSPVDVAILGVQLALGGAGKHQDEYPDAARRELAREPLPPAACVRDDERLLLGVAAGIGAAAPQLADELVVILRAREHTTNVRQRCLDLWAESLARGAPKLTADITRRAMRHFGAGEKLRPVADEDRIALFWLATRLLEAPWTPADNELAILDSVLADGRRFALTFSIIRKEILLDERTYQEHPYIDTVVVFVHDPGRHIAFDARTAFESDLTTQVTVSGRTIRYVVRVR